MKNNKLANLISLLRPKHIVKNFLIFIPLLFGIKAISQEQILNTFGGFIVFCLVASSIYIINDYKDIEKDKVLTVWSKPLYGCVDFGFRVTPRCDSICGFASNGHIINHKENIGRRI